MAQEPTQAEKVRTRTNVIRKFETEVIIPNKEMAKPELQQWLQIREIFLTLQGEGPFAGQRAVFVRTTGCPIQCGFCDTAWNDITDPKMPVSDITDRVKSLWGESLEDPLVVITGGEPTRQPINFLVEYLRSEMNATVQIETAGIYYRSCMADKGVFTVVSPKTPVVAPLVQEKAEAWKYVISAEDEKCPDTGIPITATQPGARPARLCIPPSWVARNQVYLSPCDVGDAKKNNANLQEAARLAMKHGYTLGVQLHKLIGYE